MDNRAFRRLLQGAIRHPDKGTSHVKPPAKHEFIPKKLTWMYGYVLAAALSPMSIESHWLKLRAPSALGCTYKAEHTRQECRSSMHGVCNLPVRCNAGTVRREVHTCTSPL
jgi:hypothetical protein